MVIEHKTQSDLDVHFSFVVEFLFVFSPLIRFSFSCALHNSLLVVHSLSWSPTLHTIFAHNPLITFHVLCPMGDYKSKLKGEVEIDGGCAR